MHVKQISKVARPAFAENGETKDPILSWLLELLGKGDNNNAS